MMGGRLEGLTIAVVGGDEREQEIARLAALDGARVRGYGFPWPDGGVAGVDLAASAPEAVDGVDYALFPIPGISQDGSLYAPSSPAPIIPDASLLNRMKPGAAIIMGTADDQLRTRAVTSGHPIVEYESDTELMLLRGPAIVEGAIGLAISNTLITLHDASVGVVGQGNIGRLLSRKLVALSAHVHVFARSPVQRADAYAAGCAAHPLEDLLSMAATIDMLFSTVSAPVVDRSILANLVRGTLVMDLAAPPGSVDLAAANELGLRAIWARGLGRRAPVTVGRSQWSGIVGRIIELEEKRSNEG
jgi:dipicolinate synthase subunit A